MKRFLIILSLVLMTTDVVNAQTDASKRKPKSQATTATQKPVSKKQNVSSNVGTNASTASSQSSLPRTYDAEIFIVNGVSFKMIPVEGGTFKMGATSDQGSDADSDEKPSHKVTLSTYSIGQTEVTQALWKAVMGSNPSNWKGDNLPVEQVSWNDCQEFVRKLNRLTGKQFRLPTEAEWEYAARGGGKSRGYKYSGSNTLGDVAWYGDNSSGKTHTVATKKANELGLYDMSGNVWEWCQDWYDWYGNYSSGSQTNPTGPNGGSGRVYRGGSWFSDSWACRVSGRNDYAPSHSYSNLGLRLVLSEEQNTSSKTEANTSNGLTQSSQIEPSYGNERTFTVNGASFKMIKVEGGTFKMGATSEQGSEADSEEKPSHIVTLSTYLIGQTEVTQALWKAVMGSNPSYFKGDNLPVEQVSWNDCQEFVRKLNQLTGKQFRLPTEAEWEYAARGGRKSRGYKYSGSNTLGDVAWYDYNSGSKTHAVGTKQANELGLYDLTGNVWEWCQDWYGNYSNGPQTNPTGPTSGSDHVRRGGCWFNYSWTCRVSHRNNVTPSTGNHFLGLRLVLSE